ncbi:MAG: DUF1624 domain-containing protein [Planctomycetes bacterium]|nr:DUF1624 domain-containing protein [Planctomycetota bacterium]MCB9918277.1 DUF1624 domain-containing protein [Planctomycetota bacterium]
MVLMTVDHASEFFNAGRFHGDSAYLVDPRTGIPLWSDSEALDLAQFFTRNITHLCAPTFLFLAGASVSMSMARRMQNGVGDSSFDRHLVARGLVLFGFEALLSVLADQGVLILQVLWAIGVSLILAPLTRRMSAATQLVLGGGWILVSEAITRRACPIGQPIGTLGELFLAPSLSAPITSLYPALHWFAIFVLGQAFGSYAVALPSSEESREHRLSTTLIRAGLLCLALFVVLRAIDGYGNMGLHRESSPTRSAIENVVLWLHVSKYPPSITFVALELGVMALVLAALERLAQRGSTGRERGISTRNPILVFGQTALFYYILHFLVIGSTLVVSGSPYASRGLGTTFVVAALCWIVLYPTCLGYRALKRRYPQSVLRYL